MPTAVLDLDLSRLPSEISGLERYSHAYILVRFGGRPVGSAHVRLVDGRIAGDDLREALIHAAGWRLWEAWLDMRLRPEEAGSIRPLHQSATIAVCTRDRPAELRRCLDALDRLFAERQEIVVVDNCPKTDETCRLVKRYGSMRYVREDRPGLNSARNRALREARHEFVAFIDDDAVPDPDWLQVLLSNFDDPLVFCVTGLTMPLELETKAQEWFERCSPFGRGFTRVVYDSSNCSPPSAGRAGAGVNMAFRRSVLNHVGSFDETLDAGTPTRSGGDTEMLSRLLATGYRIVYDPAALNWHLHKKTWEELTQTLYGYGVGLYAFWMRTLLVEREWSVLKTASAWFFKYQLRQILSNLLRRPGRRPLDLIWAELRGCFWGPWAYVQSRRLRSRIIGYDEN
ncbi:MAG: glycosyltransferase [Desulfobacteraceae bacterium]|nr:MAG: glycosyltransferase [Desulfobacteraceae bacterium]